MRTLLLTLLAVTLAQAQPYNPVVLWDRSGAGDHSRYGIPQSLGDQNDDGYADFGVWALGWGAPGQASEAVAELFHGGNPPDTMPYMTFRSDTAAGQDFWRFQSVGDLNGDGFVDWQVWMYREQDPIPFTINTYWGGPQADTIPDLIFHIPVQSWVYPAGDFNGDGFDDLYLAYIIGDSGTVLFGGNPMDTLADWRLQSPPEYPYIALPQSFGDLNGDGYSDFVSGNSVESFILLGGANPGTVPVYAWNYSSGWSEIIRSLNGDRFDDLVFHGLRVHFGRDSLLSTPDYVLNFHDNCSPLWKFSLGDINRDGYSDMAVIDDGCNNLWGTLCLYLGHPWLNLDPAITIEGRDPPLNLIGINTAAGFGDVNGDHLDDFAIGAFNSNWDGFRGRCVILSGDSALRVDVQSRRPELPQQLAVSIYPNPFNSEATILLETPLYSAEVSLTVYNLLGQVVNQATLQNVVGTTRYHFDAAGLPSGMYLLHARTGSFTNTQKLMVLR